jgi:hypothetical protein
MLTVQYDHVSLNELGARLSVAAQGSLDVLRQAIASPEALKWLQEVGTRGLTKAVYEAYSPTEYKRTYALLNGVLAEVEEDTPDRLSVVLRLKDEDSALHAEQPGYEGLLYARFFLPGTVGGWLSRTVPQTLPRDFVQAWIDAIHAELPERIGRARAGATAGNI